LPAPSDSAQTRPLCASMTNFTVYRPYPVLSTLVFTDSFPLPPSVNKFFLSSSVIPRPVSFIENFICLKLFTFPSYMAIFTRHIDKKKEGTEWGIYFTFTDLIGAALAIVGGYVATTQGFPTLIVAVVVVSFVGAMLLWPIKPYIKTRS